MMVIFLEVRFRFVGISGISVTAAADIVIRVFTVVVTAAVAAAGFIGGVSLV